jgi:tetratricopeptide (TPR) repeat protein
MVFGRHVRRRGEVVAAGVAMFAIVALSLGALVRAEDSPPPLSPAPPAPPAVPAPPSATIEQAELLLEKNDVPAALAAFQTLADAPGGTENARVQSGLGRSRLRLGDPRGAIDPLAIAVARRGSNDDHLAYADVLLVVAKLNLAEGGRSVISGRACLSDAVTQAVATKDVTPAESLRVAKLVGEAKWRLGELASAREALSAPSLRGDTVAQDLLARVCWDLKDFGAAAQAWEAAGNPRGVAVAHSMAKDERGVFEYAALVKAAPRDLTLLDEATRAAITVGKVTALDEALAAIPSGGAPIARARGRLAEWAGQKDVAVTRYREARTLAPEDLDVATDLARALIASNPEDAAVVAEATALYLDVVKTRPTDEWARSGLGFVASRDADAAVREWPSRRRLDRTVTIFRAFADADPTDSTAWQNLGNALRVAGDPAGAVAALEKAVAANPYDAALENDLGIELVALGERDRALAAFERAVALDPGDPSARQNAGRLRRLRGDFDAARDHFGVALASTRTIGGHPSMFRCLLDRVWRQRTGK